MESVNVSQPLFHHGYSADGTMKLELLPEEIFEKPWCVFGT